MRTLQHNLKQTLIITLSLAISITAIIAINSKPLNAASTANFNPGKIIDDGIFVNSSSMNVSQIQNFLNSKVPTCDTYGTRTSEFGGGTRAQWAAARGYYPPFTCLKDAYEGGRSSSQIIYDVAQQFQINPQVLIVLLQKEQGLVTDTWPTHNQYRTATGYGCPDTAPCDSQYYGLTNQLTWSARMFRAIMNASPTWYTPYVVGNNYIRWSPTASCGGSTINIQNRSTQALYNYTPYQPNQAALNAGYGTGDGCSAYGNRNFYLYFNDWFGSTTLPTAIKSSDSATVYIQSSGYKFAVPSIAMLQDYGISPESIVTVAPSVVNGIPSPSAATGLSSSIGYLVKSESDSDADSGAVYLVSVGKRYAFQSMDQLFSYGFQANQILKIPYGYLSNLGDGGALSQFISTPSSNVFRVAEGKKRIIFDLSVYVSLNPSRAVNAVSTTTAALIASAKPISETPVLVKKNDSSVHLLSNDNYYSIPSMDVFNCWGFNGRQSTQLNTLVSDEFIEPIPQNSPALSCNVVANNKRIILAGTDNLSYAVPDNFQITNGQQLTTELSNIALRLPQATLSPFVKSSTSEAVWKLESGTKRLIPSYSNLTLLGYPNTHTIATIDNVTISSISTGPNILGNGQVVKSDSSDAVYSIIDNKRTIYSSPELFIAYGNNWSAIETYPQVYLDTNYPIASFNSSHYLSTTDTNINYLVDENYCMILDLQTLNAYGQNRSSLQSYSASKYPFIKTQNCTASTKFIKSTNSPVVYYIDNGAKHALSSWAKLLELNSNAQPNVRTLTSSALNTIPSGPTL